jgi:hypothetical protein
VPREATRDPEVIAAGNPALEIRIDLEHVVQTEREAMDHRTFCVERLGVGDWPTVDPDVGHAISTKQWAGLVDMRSAPVDPVVFAFDVKPDRSASAIGVAGLRSDGILHAEIVEHRPGTSWVAGTGP